jgi:flagellar motor switch protein FliG
MQKRSIDVLISDEGILPTNPVPQMKRPAQTPVPPTSDSGATRAAKLLLSLGPDQASVILREMEPAEVEKVVSEMIRIRSITATEKKSILGEFHAIVEDFDPPVRGGIDSATDLLVRSLGEQKAGEILSRVNRRDVRNDFAFLEGIDPNLLSTVLSAEHPQVVAIALASIHPRTAASVLRSFPDELRAAVSLRIAKTSKTHPDALEKVARVLREKFEKRKDEIYSEVGVADTLATILNHMDRDLEDNILKELETAAPDLLTTVKEKLYTFEELIALTPKEMRLLASQINDDSILACALRGAGEDMRRMFFNNLSQNRAADILEEIDRRGPISLREIHEARGFILSAARRLDDEGRIVIKKSKEEYV